MSQNRIRVLKPSRLRFSRKGQETQIQVFGEHPQTKKELNNTRFIYCLWFLNRAKHCIAEDDLKILISPGVYLSSAKVIGVC